MDYKINLTLDEYINLKSSVIDSLFPKFDSKLKIVYKKYSKVEGTIIEQLQNSIKESCKINKIKNDKQLRLHKI
jgi:hypothetical protein